MKREARRLAQLERLGTMRHWERRARRERIFLVWARWRARTWDRLDHTRQGTRALGALLRGAAVSGFAAVLAVVVLEVVARALNHRGSPLHRLVAPVEASKYEAFVAAAVGAEAVFLALFFTTVGVIAATAYADVPNAVRQLFVRERASVIYAYTVVWALVFGVVILASGPVGYSPHALSVETFGLLSLLSVLSLVRLGTGLFNFFDLSSLSTALPGRFRRAAKQAAAPDPVVSEGQQHSLHGQAQTSGSSGRGCPVIRAFSWSSSVGKSI